MGRALLIVAAALTLAACGGDGHDDGTLTVYEVPDTELSLGVPKTWTAVTRRELAETGAIERFARENPAFEPFLQNLARPDSSVKFVALDPTVRDGFVTNVNVVVQDVPRGIELDELGRSSTAELEGLGVVHRLETHAVTLPAGEALKMTYRMELRYGSSTRSVATLQYALIEDGKSYVVTYSTLPGLEREYAGAFADSAQSLQLGDY